MAQQHNTNKDQKFDKNKVQKRSKKKPEDQTKPIGDTADAQKESAVGGRSCLRSSSENDPEWYSQSEQLLRDAFSLSMASRLGGQFAVSTPIDDSTSTPYLQPTSWSVPGVYTLDIAPVPGISTDGTSAVNVASKKLFSYIRHANSGAANYDASDLMTYLLAMDNAYALWNWLVRAYGVARVYSTYNSYLPSGLLATMNMDAENIQANLCVLRSIINQLGAKLNTRKVPAHLSYFKRHAWLFSNVFADSATAKAQLYLYNPAVLYKWTETTVSGQLPYLEPVELCTQGGTTWRIDGLETLVTSFINPIFYSGDFDIMSGDIEKAYGAENCYTVPEINEDYATLPVESAEVAMQFENARIPGVVPAVTDASWRITQSNEGFLVFNPTCKYNRADLADSHLYNFHIDEVTPSHVAVATRLNFIPNEVDAHAAKGSYIVTGTLGSCGSELVVRARIWRLISSTGGEYSWQNYFIKSNVICETAAGLATTLDKLCAASQFKWSPIINVYSSTGTQGATETYHGVLGDLDNYTQIDVSTLVRMNDVALLSMFGIPGSAGV